MTNSVFLASTANRISGAIIAFCRNHERAEFFADDLRNYVREQVGYCAPGSADRVLRDLRKRGLVMYRCIDRGNSRYTVDGVTA